MIRMRSGLESPKLRGTVARIWHHMPIVYICSRGSNVDYEDSQRNDRDETTDRSGEVLFIMSYLLLLLAQAASVLLTKVYSLIRQCRSQ